MAPSSTCVYYIHCHISFTLNIFVQFVLEVANPQPYIFIARSMFITSTGALQMWQQDAVQWTREESLAEINTVEFVDLPEKKVAGEAVDGSDFVARLLRQIGDARVGLSLLHLVLTCHHGTFSLQNFPSYAKQFGRRFLTGSETATGSSAAKAVGGPLHRDAFGFRKVLIAATSTGKVFGIDTAHGNIVWSRFLAEGSNGGSVRPFKLFATATVSDGKQPEIVLLAHRESPSVYLEELLAQCSMADPFV